MSKGESSTLSEVRAELGSDLVRTRYGIEFDASQDVWPIDGTHALDVGDIRGQLALGLQFGLEMTLRESASRYSWSTLDQFRWSLKHFRATQFPEGQITRFRLADMRLYRVALIKAFGHEDYLRHIRSMLVNWQKGRWPGVSKELIDALQEMRLKGVEAGRAVRTIR